MSQTLSKNWWAKKIHCLLSMYEVQLTQKSHSNQATFCWSLWKIHVTNLMWNLREQIFHRQAEIQIARIPIEMTRFQPWEFAEMCKCDLRTCQWKLQNLKILKWIVTLWRVNDDSIFRWTIPLNHLMEQFTQWHSKPAVISVIHFKNIHVFWWTILLSTVV